MQSEGYESTGYASEVNTPSMDGVEPVPYGDATGPEICDDCSKDLEVDTQYCDGRLGVCTQCTHITVIRPTW